MNASDPHATGVGGTAPSPPAVALEPRTSFGWSANRRWLPVLLVALLAALAAAIRLPVASQDLFADELSTYWIVSTNGLGDVLTTVESNAEITPPLSFVTGWLATQVELSPEWLRVPSLLAGVASVPGMYLLGVRTVGRAAGIVAAALTAFAPFMIFYSGEARGYALMMAFVLYSTIAMLFALDSGRMRWWVAYAVCSAAAVYTHYTCVFVLAAQLLWLLWAHPEARRPALVANGAAALAFAPWIPGLIRDLRSPTTDILALLQPFDVEHIRLSLAHWSIGYPYASAPLTDLPGTPALLLLGAAVAIALVGLRRRPETLRSRMLQGDRRAILVLALALSTPVGAAIVSAIEITTVFSTRNLAASWPGFGLALAALLVSPRAGLRVASVALALVAFAIGAAKMLDDRFERPDYSGAAAFLERSAGPRDVVIDETAVLSPGPLSHIDPLLERRHPTVRSRAPQETEQPFNIFHGNVLPEDAARRAVAAARGGRIFLVTDRSGLGIPRPMDPYRLVDSEQFPAMIDLFVQTYAVRTEPAG